MQSLYRYSIWFASVCLLMCGCKTIKPDVPLVTADNIPVIPQQVSYINLPITANIQSLFDDANNNLDRHFEKSENPCEGVRYSFKADRENLSFALSGNTLNINTKVLYGARATYCAFCTKIFGCTLPMITASCGVDGESPRAINVGISSALAINPNYSLYSQTSLVNFSPNNRCKVFIINYDVTNKLIGVAKPKFESLLGRLDSRIAAVSIRDKVDKLWTELQKPLSLGNFGKLRIQPEALSLSAFEGSGSNISCKLNLRAKPIIGTDDNADSHLQCIKLISGEVSRT